MNGTKRFLFFRLSVFRSLVRLRTSPCFFSSPMSESVPRFQTRSCFFGSPLSEALACRSSQTRLLRPPVQCQLQTRSCFFGSPLSEAATTSDTILLFRLSLVRSCHDFRHDPAFSALPCPKSAQLQTRSCFFGSPLSKAATTSDTILLFRLSLVRSSPRLQTRILLFRLSLVRSLRNFRHDPAFSVLPCPKLPRLGAQSVFVPREDNLIMGFPI